MTCAYHETSLTILGVEWKDAEELDRCGDELRCFNVRGVVNVALPGSAEDEELNLQVEGVPVTGEIHSDPDDPQWLALDDRQAAAALEAAFDVLPTAFYAERETGDIYRVYEYFPDCNRVERLNGNCVAGLTNEEINRRFVALNPISVNKLASGLGVRD